MLQAGNVYAVFIVSNNTCILSIDLISTIAEIECVAKTIVASCFKGLQTKQMNSPIFAAVIGSGGSSTRIKRESGLNPELSRSCDKLHSL